MEEQLRLFDSQRREKQAIHEKSSLNGSVWNRPTVTGTV
eukprot:CAMPEP_0194440200 /NCGR_PEP_ID=MMETSP0176-20130528/114628_1 /TAXON_ID=216777 /ORGANISM="Proboscia alata, Strain PI-D3" /LENGTH=38 /DNA_ID= /DNA_START= /DNA_END= /DNA_ORIENTATION=